MLSELSICTCLILPWCFLWIASDLCLFSTVHIDIAQTHYGAMDTTWMETAWVVCVHCVWQIAFYGEIVRQFGEGKHTDKSYMSSISFSGIRSRKDPVFPTLAVPVAVLVAKESAGHCAPSLCWQCWMKVQQHSSMGTEVGRKEARRSWTFSHVGFKVKEWRKKRSIYFLRKALKFLCGGLRSKSLQLVVWERHHQRRFVWNTPAHGKKGAIWMCINTAVLQPMDGRLERGKASGKLPALPGKSHILLPPGVTEIYEAARLRHSFSISITSPRAPCWHILGTYLCCWEQSPAQALTFNSGLCCEVHSETAAAFKEKLPS